MASNIGDDIRGYLLSHPEIVWEALELHHKNVRQESLNNVSLDKDSQIVVANPEGKNTLIMFVDYRCGACRRSYIWVEDFIKNNPDVKLVMKPYPVLGADSVQASLMMYDADQSGVADQLNADLIDASFSFSQERLRSLGRRYKINVHLPSSLDKHQAYTLLERTHEHSMALENKTVPLFIVAVDGKCKYGVLQGLSSKDELSRVYNQLL